MVHFAAVELAAILQERGAGFAAEAAGEELGVDEAAAGGDFFHAFLGFGEQAFDVADAKALDFFQG